MGQENVFKNTVVQDTGSRAVRNQRREIQGILNKNVETKLCG